MQAIAPGSQVLISLPAEPGDLTHEVWGWVLEKRAEPGCLWIVIDSDSGIVLHRNPRYANNSVVKVESQAIQAIILRDPAGPVLLISCAEEDDTILEIRRVDGKLSPLMVQVDRGTEGVLYRVDHIGNESCPLPGSY